MLAGLLLLNFLLCGHYSPLCQDGAQLSIFHVPKYYVSFLFRVIFFPFFFAFICLYLCFAVVLVELGEGAR